MVIVQLEGLPELPLPEGDVVIGHFRRILPLQGLIQNHMFLRNAILLQQPHHANQVHNPEQLLLLLFLSQALLDLVVLDDVPPSLLTEHLVLCADEPGQLLVVLLALLYVGSLVLVDYVL